MGMEGRRSCGEVGMGNWAFGSFQVEWVGESLELRGFGIAWVLSLTGAIEFTTCASELRRLEKVMVFIGDQI